MTAAHRKAGRLTQLLRWSARGIGTLATGLYLLFLIESGARVIPALAWSDLRGLPLFLALTVSVAGILIAWRWETLGSALTIIGAVAIIALACASPGHARLLESVILTLPLFATGVLTLTCCSGIRLYTPTPERQAPSRQSDRTVAIA